MRTTITIDYELLRETMRVSGKKKYSEAVVTALADYVATKRRLAFLDKLVSEKLPHSFAKIKKARKDRSWSS